MASQTGQALRPGEMRSPASSSAPMAPTDAASVGVAMPPRIEPRTAMMSSSGGSRMSSSRPMGSRSVEGGKAGARSGRRQAVNRM